MTDLAETLASILASPCRETALEHALHRAWGDAYTLGYDDCHMFKDANERANPYAEPCCLHCDGDGWVHGTTSDPYVMDPPEVTCRHCHGAGK